jgi:hypothetical protein
MFLRNLVSTASFAALTCSLAQAGVVTGQIVDTQGHPVQNALFAFKPMQGNGIPFVTGGFTDANGMFTTTVTPDDNYRMTVMPLPPPQSLDVTRRLNDVVVGTTTNNLGTVVLQVGYALSGRVVNTSGTPLINVGLEFVGAPDFQPLDFMNGDTDAFGRFTVAVPFGQNTINFESGVVPYYGGPSTAPDSHSWNVTGTLDVGDVVLPNGFGLSGVVLEQGTNAPVDDAEVDVVRSATGESVYAPGNRTGVNGAFSLILPAGTYDFHIMPRVQDGLAPATILNHVVPPGGSLGTTFLSPGVELKGKALDQNGVPREGVQIALVNAATNAHVFLTDNLTAVDGKYRVLVPTGTFHVTFSPPYTIPFGPETIQNVTINHNTSQDASLPAVQLFTTVGTGTPGQGGIVPQISAAGGTPRVGNLGYTAVCSNGCGGAAAMIGTWMGTPPPFPGTRLTASDRWRVSFLHLDGTAGVAGAGSAMFSLPIPNSSALVGQQIRANFVVFDAAAPSGHATTQELRATIVP